MSIGHAYILLVLLFVQAEPEETLEPGILLDRKAAPEVRALLGVELAVGESYLRRSIISTRTPYGFKINEVHKESPAGRAGWRKGDILLEWNGQPVKRVAELLARLKEAEPGQSVSYKISRLKRPIKILSRKPWQQMKGEVVVKAADEPATAFARHMKRERAAASEIRTLIGVDFSIWESYIRRNIVSTRTPYGFKIIEVVKGSTAARAGWKEGDILLALDQKPVKTVAELLEQLKAAEPEYAFSFNISRRKSGVSFLSRKVWNSIEGSLAVE